jgi:hypothetical protein
MVRNSVSLVTTCKRLPGSVVWLLQTFFWYTHNVKLVSERLLLAAPSSNRRPPVVAQANAHVPIGGGWTTIQSVSTPNGLVSGPYYGAIQVRPNRDIRLRAPATSLRPFPPYLALGTVPYGALSSRSVVPYGRGGARWTSFASVSSHTLSSNVLFGLVRLLCSHSLASFATPCRKRNSP